MSTKLYIGADLCKASFTDSVTVNGHQLMENRVKILRAERGWSQSDLGQKLEVSRQSVNAIETGRFDPSLPLAFRIAELFDLPIEEIFVSPTRRSSKAI